MGYTHYYEIDTNKYEIDMYEELLPTVKKLVSYNQKHNLQGHITGWDGDTATAPEFTDERIAFNGVYPHSCESFIIPSEPEVNWEGGLALGFCKTRGIGYDALVCAVLIAMKDHYGDAVLVSSDGSWEDWSAGAAMYEAVMGRPADCPFTKVVN